MSAAAARCGALCRSNKFRLIFSDVLHAGAIVIMIITLALGSTQPKSSFSWSKFHSVVAPSGNGDGTWNLGLLDWQYCAIGQCKTLKANDIPSTSSIANSCYTAGQGVIAAATFAMLFGLLNILLIHYIASFKDRCRIPFPRIILTLTSFLSLCLYIVVVATWYEKCHNNISNGLWCIELNGATCGGAGPESLAAGYCVATAIVCVVLSFLAWAFSFWRVCRPGKDEPSSPKAAKAGSGYETQSSSSDLRVQSPSAAQEAYKPPAAASAPSSGGSYGGAYGGSNGTYGNSDSNEEEEGQASGGYGGGGGAYSNSAYGGAYGGSSKKQESAYGY